MAKINTIENKNPVKRKTAKKVRTQPVEIHWTSFEVRNLPSGRQQEIADKLLEYVNQKDKYTINGFLGEENISKAVWADWCSKYPAINSALERAKVLLGAKRFDAAASKGGSDKLLMWAGQYDVDAFNYLKLLEELKAKKEEEKKAQEIHIHMTDYIAEPTPLEIEMHMHQHEEN